MRIGIWLLGTELLALDMGGSQVVRLEAGEPEDAISAGSGGQFEIGFVTTDSEAADRC